VTLPAAQPLPEVLDALRERGLRRGVAPLPGEVVIPAVPTGHAALDAALATGGWPRGALAVLDAAPGHGATSLAHDSVAAAQAAGGLAAWVDLSGTFDAALAARRGVRLEWLLLIRPADGAEAIELAAWLIRSHLLDVLVLDLDGSAVPRWDRLAALLPRSDATVLLLAPPALRQAAGRVAGVRVQLERRAWLAVGRDLVGLRTAASVTRHRWALAGGTAELDLYFGEGRRIDALLPALVVPQAPALEQPEELPALTVLSA
jgi:RecA/RadA recombinase